MSSLIHPLPVRLQVFPSKFNALSAKSFVFLPVIRLKFSRISLTVRARSAPTPPWPPLPETPQYIFDILDGEDVRYIPCKRTYENDLGRLNVVGDVDLEQALTAAAADGGEAAEWYIAHGFDAMTAETVYRCHSDEHSTISTTLSLPSRTVKETAKDLRYSLNQDILSNTPSTTILAMAFRHVTLQKLAIFKLDMFKPGTTRNMKDLENQREVPPSFSFRTSNTQAISKLAEVISISALESTKKDFLDNSLGKSSFNIFHLFHKHEQISSQDSSVILYKLHEDEVVEFAKSLLEKFVSMKESYTPKENALKSNWWPWSILSKLEKIGGKEFSAWVSEYVPAYRLQIRSDKLQDLKLEGWKECAENKWEVLLTHSQMVCLANILDMYYEDIYTLLNKKLPYNSATTINNMNIKKKGNSLVKMLSTLIISGCFIVAISVMGRIFLPRFQNGQKNLGMNQRPQSSHTESIRLWSIESNMLEDICISIVKKIQAVYNWNGEIRKESGGGVSTGELPDYLRKLVKVDSNKNATSSSSADITNQEILASGHKVASYQIVLSSEGKIVGFQPTSLLAVNNWASNPLTEELYGRKKLKPGFFEPSLKVKQPKEVVLLELVMSEISGSHFVLVRPVNVPV